MARLHKSSADTSIVPTAHPPKINRRTAVLELCATVACLQWSDAAQAATSSIVSNVETPNSDPYIQDLLRKSEEKREERAKARLEDYNRRNFKDYFEFQNGVGTRGLSPETAGDIKKWLKDNS